MNIDEIVKIQKIEHKDKGPLETLYINLDALKKEYGYAGLWFACDRSEKKYIVTQLYYSQDPSAPMPEEPAEEIPENNFKKIRRCVLDLNESYVRVAASTSPETYCQFKLFPVQKEKSYINYKLTRTRGDKFDVVGKGLIKGSQATFMKIGIEDGTGAIDFNDTIYYLVFVRELPPADWEFDLSYLGVDKCPVLTTVYNFPEDLKYTQWLGQSPLDGRI
ncbi:MAG: hypothetical protein JW969_12300 [Spirochaetales bacterium]|nr:hypothetical protein [Spirochaetales bacterium]